MGLFRGAGSLMRGSMKASFLTGSMIASAINNAKTKKEIRNIYKSATEANYQSRAVAVLPSLNKQQLLLTSNDPNDNDVYNYPIETSTPAIDFIWGTNNTLDGLLVSGGRNKDRVKALMPFVRKSQNTGMPLIAIYSGDFELETMLFDEGVAHEFVTRSGVYYDVFRGIPIADIAYLLYETMPSSMASPSAEPLLQALVEVVVRVEGTVVIQKLAEFPIHNLKDKLDELYKTGAMTADDYHEINHNYMAGSSELNNVRNFLKRLNMQMEGVYGKPKKSICNIKKMINQKGIAAICIGNANNELLVSLVMNHLQYLKYQGREFAILLDDLAISKHPKSYDLLHNRIYAISHKDFVSSIYGGERSGEEAFTEIMGFISTVVLFGHSSSASCKKWSEFLGTYHKIRIKMNISQSRGLLTSNNTSGISVDEADEPRIRAETLLKIPSGVACISQSEGILLAEV